MQNIYSHTSQQQQHHQFKDILYYKLCSYCVCERVYAVVAHTIHHTAQSCIFVSFFGRRQNKRTHTYTHLHIPTTATTIYGWKCQCSQVLLVFDARLCTCICFNVCVSKWRPSFYFLLVASNLVACLLRTFD